MTWMQKKIIKKKRIKWKTFFHLFLILLFFGVFYFYIENLPTKQILIQGNHYTSDYEIILAIGYKNYPKLFSKSEAELKSNIKKLEMIDSVKISRSFFGVLTIQVTESIPLFYNRNSNKVVLANKKEIFNDEFLGLPILVNYVPDSYYEKLIDKFKEVDENVRSLISEIEYQPWKSNDVMIDETRFFLRMNDGNSVYINLLHINKLNNYIEIYASLEGKHGNLYLDSSSDKISFSEYK